MYQRCACPSMGLIRRSLNHDVSAISNCPQRSFSTSLKWLEESNSSAPPKPVRDTRATRAASAYQKLNTLSQQRQAAPKGLRGGMFRSGQQGQTPSDPSSTSRVAARPGPPGKMVRAPNTLRITRTPVEGPVRSQAPRPRALRTPSIETNAARPAGGMLSRERPGGNRTGARRGGAGGQYEAQLKRRDAALARMEEDEVETIEDTLSDGMVQQLLRLQRKEWDRVPYEPKYAEGSKEATELLALGKKLLAGEKPQKHYSKLDRTLGLQHMHGA